MGTQVRRDRTKTALSPLLNEKGELATTDMEEVEVLNAFSASVFAGSQDSHIPEPKTLGGSCVSKLPPL